MPHVPDLIQTELQRIETQHNVKILLAVESGSRAWGFASQDSDWDVRFVYVHPRDWYLSIKDQRDVIEEMLPNDLDISGWDLRKALRLFQKTNPSLVEWMNSPLVYFKNPALLDPWLALVPQYLSPERCHYHYFHMAQGNFRDYLQHETVWIKKYLYVLRPILCCLYLETYREAPPVAFKKLVQTTVQDPALLQEIQTLVQAKKAGQELSQGPRIEVIDHFVRHQLQRLEDQRPTPSPPPSAEPLDAYFRQVLDQIEKPD